MASSIKAGNATDGIQITSDNTGALELKTGSGAGATAISIDASQNVTIPGTLTIAGQPAGGNYALNSYVAPATWTKPTGLKAVKVTVVGAGGSGGSATNPTTSVQSSAGGGGGGGAAIQYIPAPSIPGPVVVTAGAGTNSFGAFCSATAGSNAPSVVAGGLGSPGGAGGSGSGGTFNIAGGGGVSVGSGGYASGAGGASILGGGGAGVGGPAVGANPGGNYGGGGSGGNRPNPNAGTSPGGAGAPGIVIVEEFY